MINENYFVINQSRSLTKKGLTRTMESYCIEYTEMTKSSPRKDNTYTYVVI